MSGTPPRTLIRRQAQALLLGQTAAEDRVHATRAVPWNAGATFPAIAIYTPEEPVDPESRKTTTRDKYRTASLVIEGVVLPGENVDEAMDALAQEIEDVLDLHEALGGLGGEDWAVNDCWLVRTDMETHDDGEQEIGIVKLSYDVQYDTRTKTNANADFRTASTSYSLGNAQDAADRVSDLTTIAHEY